MNKPRFDGADYDHKRDYERLSGQILDVYLTMKDGVWRTVEQISSVTGHPEPSVSAQLRNLRKDRFGGHVVNCRHIKNGLYEYKLDLYAEKTTCKKDLRVRSKRELKAENHELKKFLQKILMTVETTGQYQITGHSKDVAKMRDFINI